MQYLYTLQDAGLPFASTIVCTRTRRTTVWSRGLL